MVDKEELEEFCHLWDGSENWVLIKGHYNRTALTILFADRDPNIREIAAMRSLLPQYRNLAPRDIKNLVKHSGELDMEPMSIEEAHRLIELGQRQGLKFKVIDASYITYLPFRPADNMMYGIEDPELADRVYEKMLQAGVPVMSQLP